MKKLPGYLMLMTAVSFRQLIFCHFLSRQKERIVTFSIYFMLPGCYTYFGMNDSQTLPEQQRNQAIRRGHPLCAEEIMKQGFRSSKISGAQSKHILERVQGWDKLYLEFGGKLMLDTHAQRCLPAIRKTPNWNCWPPSRTARRSSSVSMPETLNATRSGEIWALLMGWMCCA